MTFVVTEILARTQDLLEKGQYSTALALLDSLSTEEVRTVEDSLACQLLKCRINAKLGELDLALALADKIIRDEHPYDRPLFSVDAFIVRAEIFWIRHALDEALQAIDEAESLLEKIELDHANACEAEFKYRKAELLRHSGIVYWYKGDLDRALERLQQSMVMYRQLENRQGFANCLHYQGSVYWSMGNLDRSLELSMKSLTIREELGNKDDIAFSLNNIGAIYSWTGDLDLAMEYTMRSLEIRQEVGNKQNVAFSMLNLATIHLQKGELDQALQYNQEGLVLTQEIGDRRNISFALNNLGEIYREKGDLSRSLAYHQQSLAICEEQGRKQFTAMALIQLGVVTHMMGDLDRALDYFERSLVIHEEIGNDPATAVVLYHLISMVYHMEDQSQVRAYFHKLQHINEQTDNKVTDQRYRIAKALMLKVSTRLRDRLMAQEILEDLLQEHITDHTLTITAMVQLTDLLLLELKISGEERLLSQVNELTYDLLEFAAQISSKSLLAETYLLQSKLALVEMDLERAQKLLTRALTIAEQRGLHLLARDIRQEQTLLKTQENQWKQITGHYPSRREMIGFAQLDGFLEQMIHKTVYSLSAEEKTTILGGSPPRKYYLRHHDLLKGTQKNERHTFRVGIAQIGLSQSGNILQEYYCEGAPGLFGLLDSKLVSVRGNLKSMVERASSEGVHLLIFPELALDLNHPELLEDVSSYAKTQNMCIIPGSYHVFQAGRNLSLVISPDGVLWEQEKHIPAMIQFGNERIAEGITTEMRPRKTVIASTEFGRIAIVICRDFLDMDLRVELKNAEPPVDLIINPAFTPVTADFRAAHFDARRSIYAYCFFANVAEFGDSLIYTPEKERLERSIPSGEEGLIFKDIDLFQLRSERKKWEIEQIKSRPFIQSTR